LGLLTKIGSEFIFPLGLFGLPIKVPFPLLVIKGSDYGKKHGVFINFLYHQFWVLLENQDTRLLAKVPNYRNFLFSPIWVFLPDFPNFSRAF